ncbi:Thioredoxin-like [Salegentibacter agarivorans]|uniref:Thioredoxin-like n=1 Tax=Salegentibacter agarivorans TaxID=345907 RepID=A0A1I2NAU3_9FLAO|nr:thioredoxin family protein [Salegentibacter agarivorans]SFG00190.1 Thioredoxin-like [Salegentibacter agarivorans]
MRNTIFNIIIIIVFFSCNHHNKSNTDYQNNKSANGKDLEKAMIIGKTDNLKAFKYFNIINKSSLSLKLNNYYDEIEIIGDSLTLKIDSITEPQLIDMFSFTDNILYSAKFILKPEDTIIFEIKNKKLLIKGDKADEYNFYSNLKDSTPNYMLNSYKGNIIEYKTRVDSIYNKKVDFFNGYIEKHNIKSQTFINFIESDLKYWHLFELINPRTQKKQDSIYLVDPDGLSPIIQEEYGSKEQLFNTKNYLGDITIDDFKDENHLSLLSFKSVLPALIRNHFETSGHPKYSQQKFLAEKAVIDSNFEGKIKEFAIASLIAIYHDKGFANTKQSSFFFRNEINNFVKKYPSSKYTRDIVDLAEDLDSFELKLSESALNTKLLSKYGDTLTLGEIFSRSNKRIRVLDFWASWCPPCISEIKKAQNFKDKLSIENNVEWIYLSIDNDKDKWLKKSKELGSYLNVRNQYLVINGKNSPLGKSLKVNWIPRYIIFNKQNQIVLNNSPHPSDSIVFKKIINNIK